MCKFKVVFVLFFSQPVRVGFSGQDDNSLFPTSTCSRQKWDLPTQHMCGKWLLHSFYISLVYLSWSFIYWKTTAENRATVSDPETLGAGRMGGWIIRRIKCSAKLSCLFTSKHICFSGIYLLKWIWSLSRGGTHKDRMLITITPSTTSYL